MAVSYKHDVKNEIINILTFFGADNLAAEVKILDKIYHRTKDTYETNEAELILQMIDGLRKFIVYTL